MDKNMDIDKNMDQPNNTEEPVPFSVREQSLDSNLDDDSYKEITLQSVDLNVATCSSEPAETLTFIPTLQVVNETTQDSNNSSHLPWVFISGGPSVSNTITTQPQRIPSCMQNVITPRSLISLPNQPQSLFLQALSKLSESSVSIAVVNNMKAQSVLTGNQALKGKNQDATSLNDALKTPDSLTSAPPSYSFVLRQMAARRRPRLMGTFIPSPSFVNHTPPPNYATAFDIYVETPLPPPPIRVFDFGFTSMPAVCQECGFTGMTVVVSKITLCTHFCAIFLCLFCCWLCAPLPYIMRSCKDVRHYCRSCGHYLGMYSPTNPEAYP